MRELVHELRPTRKNSSEALSSRELRKFKKNLILIIQ